MLVPVCRPAPTVHHNSHLRWLAASALPHRRRRRRRRREAASASARSAAHRDISKYINTCSILCPTQLLEEMRWSGTVTARWKHANRLQPKNMKKKTTTNLSPFDFGCIRRHYSRCPKTLWAGSKLMANFRARICTHGSPWTGGMYCSRWDPASKTNPTIRVDSAWPGSRKICLLCS